MRVGRADALLRPLVGLRVFSLSMAWESSVHWSGGRCMDAMMVLFGFEVDHKKSHDVVEMVVFGRCVSLDGRSHIAALRGDENKALRWRHKFVWILDIGRCPPAMVGKFAGRFTWTCTVQVGKIGRAYIRPWYAQTNTRMSGFRISFFHRHSCPWCFFLRFRFLSVKKRWDIQRNHVRFWTDAFGVDRWFAAVIPHAGKIRYIQWQCSNWFWEQFAEGG